MARRFSIYILSVAYCFITSCGPMTGYGDDKTATSTTKPTAGANQDVTVHFSNNCGQDVLVYYNEILPGSILPCESLKDLGLLTRNNEIPVTVHKGKIGFIVFAETSEGKCTGGKRKAVSWIDASNASSASSYFNSCSN